MEQKKRFRSNEGEWSTQESMDGIHWLLCIPRAWPEWMGYWNNKLLTSDHTLRGWLKVLPQALYNVRNRPQEGGAPMMIRQPVPPVPPIDRECDTPVCKGGKMWVHILNQIPQKRGNNCCWTCLACTSWAAFTPCACGVWKASSKILTQNNCTCAEGQKYYLYNLTVQTTVLSAVDCSQWPFVMVCPLHTLQTWSLYLTAKSWIGLDWIGLLSRVPKYSEKLFASTHTDQE